MKKVASAIASVRCGTRFPSSFLLKCMQKIGNIEGNVVVDIGCGNGRNSRYLKKNGATVFSYDMIPDYGEYLILGRDTIPLSDSSVDIVLANYVFMFLTLEEVVHALEEVRRILKADGYFIWELYTSKTGYCKTMAEAKRLNAFIRTHFKDMEEHFLNSNKGLLKNK